MRHAHILYASCYRGYSHAAIWQCVLSKKKSQAHSLLPLWHGICWNPCTVRRINHRTMRKAKIAFYWIKEACTQTVLQSKRSSRSTMTAISWPAEAPQPDEPETLSWVGPGRNILLWNSRLFQRRSRWNLSHAHLGSSGKKKRVKQLTEEGLLYFQLISKYSANSMNKMDIYPQ